MNSVLVKMLEVLPDRFGPFVEKHAKQSDPEMKEEELKQYRADTFSRLASHNKPNKEVLFGAIFMASLDMLKLYPISSDDEKIVIMAAIGYFLDEDDVNNDLNDEFGFDDDLAVINAAFIALDKSELIVR